ncbi:ATP-dependent rRNA helicase spb4 [Physcia stellaris]|nr:ATP-dependent rRNA helicase spb4 [Physcia stellaris]
MTPRPQSSAYPKFDGGSPASKLADTLMVPGQLLEASNTGIPQRNPSDPSSSSSSGSRVEMHSLRGAFLGREEKEKEKERGKEKLGVGKKKEKGDEKRKTMTSAGMPGPLKSAMKAPSRTGSVDRIPNIDPLPEDRESLTGLLNHTTSQLQKLADRAERINEWLDMDLIVLQRLTIDAKNLALTSLPPPTLPLPLSPATAPITDKILELNNRVAAMQTWRKDLERAVFWQREEYRRIEKAMGRKRSGQSGALRNVGFDEKTKGDLVDTPMEGMLQAPGEEQAEGVERVALRPRDYARDRWTSGSSRLPNQSEWEDIFGPKTLLKR